MNRESGLCGHGRVRLTLRYGVDHESGRAGGFSFCGVCRRCGRFVHWRATCYEAMEHRLARSFRTRGG